MGLIIIYELQLNAVFLRMSRVHANIRVCEDAL